MDDNLGFDDNQKVWNRLVGAGERKQKNIDEAVVIQRSVENEAMRTDPYIQEVNELKEINMEKADIFSEKSKRSEEGNKLNNQMIRIENKPKCVNYDACGGNAIAGSNYCAECSIEFD